LDVPLSSIREEGLEIVSVAFSLPDTHLWSLVKTIKGSLRR